MPLLDFIYFFLHPVDQEKNKNENFQIFLTFFFFFGLLSDLNYRIEMSRDEIIQKIMVSDFAPLRKNDQLINERTAQNCFLDFEEADVNFEPTYRFNRGDRTFSEEKMREPAWCDRIMWKAVPRGAVKYEPPLQKKKKKKKKKKLQQKLQQKLQKSYKKTDQPYSLPQQQSLLWPFCVFVLRKAQNQKKKKSQIPEKEGKNWLLKYGINFWPANLVNCRKFFGKNYGLFFFFCLVFFPFMKNATEVCILFYKKKQKLRDCLIRNVCSEYEKTSSLFS